MKRQWNFDFYYLMKKCNVKEEINIFHSLDAPRSPDFIEIIKRLNKLKFDIYLNEFLDVINPQDYHFGYFLTIHM